MIIVRVELHSAITRKVTELARMRICNIGGTRTVGSYSVETLRGRSRDSLDRGAVQRAGQVKDYPRLRLHVWHLVARALLAMRYAGTEVEQQGDLLESPGEASTGNPADAMISQIEERFPNWRSFRDLVDCIDCTLHGLRQQ